MYTLRPSSSCMSTPQAKYCTEIGKIIVVVVVVAVLVIVVIITMIKIIIVPPFRKCADCLSIDPENLPEKTNLPV